MKIWVMSEIPTIFVEKLIMKIMKKLFSGLLVLTASAVIGTAQTKPGNQGEAPTSSQTTTTNSANFPQGWKAYNLGSKDAFKVLLPGKPEIESENLKSGAFNMKVTYFTASSDDIVTVIADIYNLPVGTESFSEDDKLFLFKNVREGLIKGIQSEFEKNGLKAEIKFYTQKSVAFQGASGYEQDLSVGQIKGKARMLSTKEHIYIFFTLLIADAKATLMDDFLNSFEIAGK